ncbi:MAG: fatty acid desaturase [Deltaproteobacteria bacterium]|nr:fatty acid desaturase [Deltaproteobacteria bacterium]
MAPKKRPDSVAEDCVRIDGELYDVRGWVHRHPGGDVLKHFFGRDATGVFAAFHGAIARKMLKGLRARNVASFAAEPAYSDDVERDFEALRARARDEGLFVSDPAWFYRRLAFIVALIASSAALLVVRPSLWALAAMPLALAWQQAGWLSHDFLHNSVYDDNDRSEILGAILGGVLLGFSGDWWKRKHNTHHALPNVLGVDQDIDTTPFLSFTEADRERMGPGTRFLVKLQSVTALPIVAFARINWVLASARWALRAPTVPRRGLELGSILVHHAWSFGMLSLLPSWPTRLGFFLASQLVSGLLTGAVFLVGHNARPIFATVEAPGFCALQCTTTQNIHAPLGLRWFFGGLDRQIEHHLFPTMPRHNHGRIAGDVRALCEAHGITYVERGFFKGLGDVAAVLFRVARAA